MTRRQEFVVGRWIGSGAWLRRGWERANRTLESTEDVLLADRFLTAGALKLAAGGHWQSLEAVRVTVEIEVGDVVGLPAGE